jgi:hypothetical protein
MDAEVDSTQNFQNDAIRPTYFLCLACDQTLSKFRALDILHIVYE